jgi:hypothetical protein
MDRELTNRNRIRGDGGQGERASNREALAIKGVRRRSGSCAAEIHDPYPGRARPTPERATIREDRSGQSAEVIVATAEAGRAKSQKAGSL